VSPAAPLKRRIWVFFLGAGAGLAGIFMDAFWLVTAALIVLLGGVVLRMSAARNSGSGGQDPAAPER
jgi:hypothetical protein